MATCKKCNYEAKQGTNACHKCGKKAAAKTKAIIIAAIIATAILVLSFVALRSDPVDDVMAAFDSGDITQAIYLISHLSDDVVENDLFDAFRERLDAFIQVDTEGYGPATTLYIINQDFSLEGIRSIEQLHIPGLQNYIDEVLSIRWAQINISTGNYYSAILNISRFNGSESGHFELITNLRRTATDRYRERTLLRVNDFANIRLPCFE